MSETLQFKNINKIPSLTWNWLKMNRDSVQITEPTFFEPEISMLPKGFSMISEGVVDIQKFPALASSVGEEFSDYLEKNIFKDISQIIILEGSAESPFVISFDYSENNAKTKQNASSLASSQIIYAKNDSEGTVIFLYTGKDSSKIDSIIRTKIYAEENAKLHIIKVQLLGKNQNQIDETSCSSSENSQIHFTQIELGGNHINSGLYTELLESKAKFNSEFAFICKDSQYFDVNHSVIHKGSDTSTKMLVKGVVDGNATKTYRGTIDFKNGCHGAMGDEQEETLLMSKTAVNKSLPIILCDEENVSGTHGATLGRLGEEELFYMQSRGISENEAKKMMTKAKILSVSNLIPDERTRTLIEEFLEIHAVTA